MSILLITRERVVSPTTGRKAWLYGLESADTHQRATGLESLDAARRLARKRLREGQRIQLAWSMDFSQKEILQ